MNKCFSLNDDPPSSLRVINEDKLFPIFCLIIFCMLKQGLFLMNAKMTEHFLFQENGVMPTSLHMTNTVFIDRAIIVQPFMTNEIPDELSGLEFANSSMPRAGDSKLPSHVQNTTESGMIVTIDESLADQGLPLFPPLPGETDEKTVEEIRRTVRD